MNWKKAMDGKLIIEFRDVEYRVPVSGTDITLYGEKVGDDVAIPQRDFIIRINGKIYPVNKMMFYKKYKVVENGI